MLTLLGQLNCSMSLLVALSIHSYQLFAMVAMKVVNSDHVCVAAITSQGGCRGGVKAVPLLSRLPCSSLAGQ